MERPGVRSALRPVRLSRGIALCESPASIRQQGRSRGAAFALLLTTGVSCLYEQPFRYICVRCTPTSCTQLSRGRRRRAACNEARADRLRCSSRRPRSSRRWGTRRGLRLLEALAVEELCVCDLAQLSRDQPVRGEPPASRAARARSRGVSARREPCRLPPRRRARPQSARAGLRARRRGRATMSIRREDRHARASRTTPRRACAAPSVRRACAPRSRGSSGVLRVECDPRGVMRVDYDADRDLVRMTSRRRHAQVRCRTRGRLPARALAHRRAGLSGLRAYARAIGRDAAGRRLGGAELRERDAARRARRRTRIPAPLDRSDDRERGPHGRGGQRRRGRPRRRRGPRRGSSSAATARGSTAPWVRSHRTRGRGRRIGCVHRARLAARGVDATASRPARRRMSLAYALLPGRGRVRRDACSARGRSPRSGRAAST